MQAHAAVVLSTPVTLFSKPQENCALLLSSSSQGGCENQRGCTPVTSLTIKLVYACVCVAPKHSRRPSLDLKKKSVACSVLSGNAQC